MHRVKVRLTVTLVNTDNEAANEDLGERLKEIPQRHPALARLRANLDGNVAGSPEITSYDRQHHRHNRS
jgi:hypothetical protein